MVVAQDGVLTPSERDRNTPRMGTSLARDRPLQRMNHRSEPTRRGRSTRRASSKLLGDDRWSVEKRLLDQERGGLGVDVRLRARRLEVSMAFPCTSFPRTAQ